MRHADTAERRHAAGPYRDLLDDIDDGMDEGRQQQASAGASEHNAFDHEDDDFEEDSME